MNISKAPAAAHTAASAALLRGGDPSTDADQSAALNGRPAQSSGSGIKSHCPAGAGIIKPASSTRETANTPTKGVRHASDLSTPLRSEGDAAAQLAEGYGLSQKKPGEPFAGGFYVGRFQIQGDEYALIVSPWDAGEIRDAEWGPYGDLIEANSYCDGLANTRAMAAAGSELAKHMLSLQIGEHSDWYLPSRDELELCYRNLKPTDEPNASSYRDGDNPSSLPPGLPYNQAAPTQTAEPRFLSPNPEAFAPDRYWTSTEQDTDSALQQEFSDGMQCDDVKRTTAYARAVRRVRVASDIATMESALEKNRLAGEQMVFSLCHAAPALFDLHSPRHDLKAVLDSVRCGLEHAIKAEPLWRDTAASEGVTFTNGMAFIARPSNSPVELTPAEPSPDWRALHWLAKVVANANEYCQQIGLSKWGESATATLIEDHKRMREALRLAEQGGEK